jgi:hypothetical protein
MGVMLGVLAADLVRLAAAAAALKAAFQSTTTGSHEAQQRAEDARARQLYPDNASPIAAEEPGLPQWPGPVTARATGQSRACVGGKIVDRSGNGWQQVDMDGRSQQCIATSE